MHLSCRVRDRHTTCERGRQTGECAHKRRLYSDGVDPGMDRRSLLGVVSASVLLAGCAGSANPGSGTPAVTGQAFSRAGDCEDPGNATVEFSADRVAIGGCISGRNSCAEAALKRVAYDKSKDTLGVAVETIDTSGASEACAEVIVHRRYELDVDVAGGLPGTVVVVHDSFGAEAVVARVER